MIENLMKYGKPGSYFIYLIPNDFFNQDNSRLIKNIILNESYLQAIIELPQDLFNAPKYQKSIMILQKKASHIKVNNEILMLSLPSFTDKEKMILAIDKINQWFKENIN
jgi:site-specific DNA-methyltransferase (adenine-specific)